MKTPNNRIGLIYPSDGVLDSEFWQFAPAHASLHFTRTQAIDEPISLSLVERMTEDTDIDYGAETLRPISPAVVTYACTSGSFALGIDGEKQLLDRIERSANAPSSTTSTALAAACHALGLERGAVAAPYIAEITDRLASFLEAKDIKVSKVTAMGLSHGIGDVSDEEVIQWGIITGPMQSSVCAVFDLKGDCFNYDEFLILYSSLSPFPQFMSDFVPLKSIIDSSITGLEMLYDAVYLSVCVYQDLNPLVGIYWCLAYGVICMLVHMRARVCVCMCVCTCVWVCVNFGY